MYVFGRGLVHPTPLMYFGSNENIAVGCLQWTLMSGILNCMIMLQTFLPFSSIIHVVFICYKRTAACTSLSNAWEVTGGKAVTPLCRALITLIQTEGSIFPSSARGRFITSSGWQLDSASVCLLSRDSRTQILALSADTEVIGTWPKTATASNTVLQSYSDTSFNPATLHSAVHIVKGIVRCLCVGQYI